MNIIYKTKKLSLYIFVILFSFRNAEMKMAESCWIDDHPTLNYIYKGPCIFSVIVNIIFLVVIVMKLVTMLNSDSSDRTAKIKTTKAIGNVS